VVTGVGAAVENGGSPRFLAKGDGPEGVRGRPTHAHGMSSLFAGPFVGWIRESGAAALWAMTRAWLDVSLALAMIRAGAGFVPNEFR